MIITMQWHNEPSRWTAEDNLISVTTSPNTDFWRKTHYGFTRDTGHFYYETVAGDFVAEVKFTGKYEALYDQAGLMARLDDTVWIKSGIELVNGVQHLSAVVTRDLSDWSVIPLPQAPGCVWLRLTRRAETVEIHYSLDGNVYHMLRLAPFTEQAHVQAGIMCASPEGKGFNVTFQNFNLQAM